MGQKWVAHYINYLELLAAFLALQTFQDQPDCLLQINSVTAMTYINKKEGIFLELDSASQKCVELVH